MCIGCYEDYGNPVIINDKTMAAAQLVRDVYEFSCVGGNLHIVLDDWNLEDSNIEFCSDRISSGGEPHESAAQLAIERKCCDAFAAMTLDERASALAMERGYFECSSTAGTAS